jgi:hypothetical protein
MHVDACPVQLDQERVEIHDRQTERSASPERRL